jgi:hypothetical protein
MCHRGRQVPTPFQKVRLAGHLKARRVSPSAPLGRLWQGGSRSDIFLPQPTVSSPKMILSRPCGWASNLILIRLVLGRMGGLSRYIPVSQSNCFVDEVAVVPRTAHRVSVRSSGTDFCVEHSSTRPISATHSCRRRSTRAEEPKPNCFHPKVPFPRRLKLARRAGGLISGVPNNLGPGSVRTVGLPCPMRPG